MVKEKVFKKVVTWEIMFDKDSLIWSLFSFGTPIFVFLTLFVCDSSKGWFALFVVLSIVGNISLFVLGVGVFFDSLPKKRIVKYVEVKK